SASDGTRINLYVQTGDEAWLARVSAYGYEGDQRGDRVDTPAPGTILAPGFGKNYPTAELRAEQTPMAQVMRIVNTKLSSIRYFGADVDYLPGGAYADIARTLSAVSAAEFINEILRTLARVPNETIGEEIERLQRGEKILESFRDSFDNDGASSLFNDAR